jgi:hypothetical protein
MTKRNVGTARSRSGIKLSVLVCAGLLLVGLLPGKISASSCIYIYKSIDDEVRSELRTARRVFSGEVTKISKIPDEVLAKPLDQMEMDEFLAALSLRGRMSVTFRVDRSWKGDPTQVVDLVTGSHEFGGYPFVIGEKYLVFAYEWKGQLIAGGCTPTSRLERAGDFLRILGMGIASEPFKLSN